MPEVQRLYRVLAVIRKIVEEHVAETAPEHDTQRRPDEKIVEIATFDERRRRAGEPDAITPADQQPDDISERVPADGKRRDRHSDRVDRRKRDREERHRRCYRSRSVRGQVTPDVAVLAAAQSGGGTGATVPGGGGRFPGCHES